MEEKNVLILGGSGFIGRNLVKYLVDNKLCGFIRVADKSLPATSYLSEEHKEAFASDRVEFKQADLSKDPHVEKVFKDHQFHYVVNLCGETRCGMAEADYQQKCVVPAEKCSAKAVEHQVEKWVEVSTAQVYDPDKKASTESSKLKPWTMVATARLQAEDIVKSRKELPSVVLRPALTYGPGDLTGLSPRIICAVTYAHKKEKMKFLWTKDLLLNSVHVLDVCSAIMLACSQLPSGSLFNLADQGNLSQGSLNAMLEGLFGINTGFLGSMVSNLAKLQLKEVANSTNDKHVPVWAKICQEAQILNTPLSPYIDKELLYNNSLSVNGTAIGEEGFKYEYPEVTPELIAQQVHLFENQGIFPAGWLKGP